jgi:hypothetical protein
MIWWKFILVMEFAFMVNYSYASYVSSVQKKSWKAPIMGEVVTVLLSLNLSEVVNNKWYLVPVVIGGFLGTWWNQRIN